MNNEYLRLLNEKQLQRRLETDHKSRELSQVRQSAETYENFMDKIRDNERKVQNQLANQYEQSIRDKVRKQRMEKHTDLETGNRMIRNAKMSLQYEQEMRKRKLEEYR